MADRFDETEENVIPIESGTLRIDVDETGKAIWRTFALAPGEWSEPAWNSSTKPTVLTIDVRVLRFASSVRCSVGVYRPVDSTLAPERIVIDQSHCCLRSFELIAPAPHPRAEDGLP